MNAKIVQRVLDIYKKRGAKIWNLDTNIYFSIERLVENIKKIKKDVDYFCIEIEKPHDNMELRYSMYIHNINITPNKGMSKPVS